MSEDNPDIKYLFEPRGVAVIGASSDKKKIGHQVVENIISQKYPGKIYPINPKGGEILGLKAYKDITDVEGEIDVACIVVPAQLVFEAVKSCAEKKVKFLIIITSGFSEIGNLEEEKKIVSYARKHGMRVIGPNVFGIYSAKASLNATFGPKANPGNVAIITQSGALGLAMTGKTAVENIGLSAIISVGNKSDVDEADLLEYLIHQELTKIIFIYIEGVRDGKRFVRVLKEATKKKPVIMIKAGRSARGAMAAASHTGALAGSDDVFDGVIRQCGVLRAESIQEAFNWCKFLANSPMPSGENAVIITNGGGIGVIATDACEKHGVTLYDDLQVLKELFSPITPSIGSTKNPIDLTGQARASNYYEALGAALGNKNIHSVIGLYCDIEIFQLENLGTMIWENYCKYKENKKPIVFSVVGGKASEQCITELRGNSVPVFSDVDDAVSCLGALYSHYRFMLEPPEKDETPEANANAIEEITAKALAEGRHFLLANEAKELMERAGIPMPKSAVARTLDEAVKSAENIGYPVVMKIVSKDIVHKSDVGGIALNLENKKEVIDAYQVLRQNVKKYKPDARIEGVEISEMLTEGTEVIIGARRDASFGPIVMFGLGGIYVEVMKDVAFRALPLSRGEALRMIKEIHSYPLLMGVRGQAPKDVDSIINMILKVGAILQNCPSISDIEINPLKVYDLNEGSKVIDARILLSSNREVNENG